jgi:poly[(R)-3-hydroxyalkanoate] polymerase subunit PhaC
LLVPLLREVGEPSALVGYCLGGTMAIAAANLTQVERVATLAAPWNFAGYGDASRNALASIWSQSRDAAHSLGALPMEVLQAAFWSLDPLRTVRKFAEFGRLDPASADARRFVALEDWANEGEPLPYPAARELIEDLFGADLTGAGEWSVGGASMTDRISRPILNVLAMHDRISPPDAAPEGAGRLIEAGHVGMIVGSARQGLHAELRRFLRKPGA